MYDAVITVASVNISLAHRAYQEDLVIHCQTVQDTSHQNRHEAKQRPAGIKTEQGVQPAPLINGCGHTEGSQNTENEADCGFDRHNNRPEHEQQNNQGKNNNDTDVNRECIRQLR
ncbi:hypothetical protein D3C80_1316400 [compost metagenome]